MAKSNFFKILGKNILPILAGIILLCVLCNISYNNAFVEGFECVGKHVAKAKGGCEEKEECCKCRTSFTHASGNMNEEMKKVGCGEKGHPCAKICAYCGSWENPCKSKVASKKQAPSKASARGLRGYKCIPGFTTPAKIVGGEVACLSKNMVKIASGREVTVMGIKLQNLSHLTFSAIAQLYCVALGTKRSGTRRVMISPIIGATK